MAQFRSAHGSVSVMTGFRRSMVDYAGELAYYRGIARRLREVDANPRRARP